MSLKLLVVGVSGRMGSEIVEAVERARSLGEDIEVFGGIVSEDSSLVGRTLRGVRSELRTDWVRDFQGADVIVDFSSADGSSKAIALARTHSIPVLIGSTGLSVQQEEDLRQAGESVAVVRASNTSVGVTVLLSLVGEASRMLGKDFEVEVVETHHHHKKDSPSGTAKSLVQAITRSRDGEHDQPLVFGRAGDKLSRRPEEIGVHSLRGGDVVGEHSVYFLGAGETVEIAHRATRRAIFAEGALRAARWLQGRKAGYYTMLDVLKN